MGGTGGRGADSWKVARTGCSCGCFVCGLVCREVTKQDVVSGKLDSVICLQLKLQGILIFTRHSNFYQALESQTLNDHSKGVWQVLRYVQFGKQYKIFFVKLYKIKLVSDDAIDIFRTDVSQIGSSHSPIDSRGCNNAIKMPWSSRGGQFLNLSSIINQHLVVVDIGSLPCAR